MKTMEILYKQMTRESGLTAKQVRAALKGFVKSATKLLRQGATVKIARFGKFRPAIQTNKRGFNVYSGKHIIIPPTMRVRFMPSEKLIKAVNEGNVRSVGRDDTVDNAGQGRGSVGQAL